MKKMKSKTKRMSNISTSNNQPLTSNVGITLVALIITIIVLLILAGVTLNMVMGDSGIFRKANWASFTTEYSKVQELSDIYAMSQKLQDYGSKTKIASTNGTGTKGKSYSEYYAKKGNQITPTGSLQKTIEAMDNIDEAQIYELDLKAINADTKNGYVINITTGRVYRNKGFKFEGNTYHVPELPLLGNGDEPPPEITETVTADRISFTPKDSNWKVENVKEALDYLYTKIK